MSAPTCPCIERNCTPQWIAYCDCPTARKYARAEPELFPVPLHKGEPK